MKEWRELFALLLRPDDSLVRIIYLKPNHLWKLCPKSTHEKATDFTQGHLGDFRIRRAQ